MVKSHELICYFIRLYLVLLPPYCKAQEGYFPFKTYEDLDGPVLDYRDSQPVYLTEFELNKFKNEQEKEDTKGQLISECLFDFFFNFPKTQWKISAPESKKWSNHKIKTLYVIH